MILINNAKITQVFLVFKILNIYKINSKGIVQNILKLINNNQSFLYFLSSNYKAIVEIISSEVSY